MTETPSTSTLDHIVFLSPPGALAETKRKFVERGFDVIPGGVHAGGLTENLLVVIKDGVYLELIALIHPIEHYPEGSEERSRLESNLWASKLPGWIDYAFLGTSPTISKIINSRAQEEGSGVRYLAEISGGRETPTGRILKWLITGPDPTSSIEGVAKRGALPFFCADVTPREWRVPTGHVEHPNGVTGIACLTVLIPTKDLDEFERQLTSVIGFTPEFGPNDERTWSLSTTTGKDSPHLIIRAPRDREEEIHVDQRKGGIYRVAFRVTQADGEGLLSV